jgi:CheY-like chemotaxis protein
VVDDEELVALTMQEGLEKLPNCEVAMATNGYMALQLFEQRPFDLLITDYQMPGLDGLTLATHIHHLYPDTATIMITAYGAKMVYNQTAPNTIIQHILDKPVKLSEIRSLTLETLAGQ